MRETGLFFLYLAACLVLAALLTWPLLQAGWLDQDPQRVMGRLAQGFILIGLWPLLKAMGVADHRSLGYGAARGRLLRAIGLGWLAGFLSLVALALVLVAIEVRVLRPQADQGLATKAVAALVSGWLIAVLEETFFRGALYAAVERRRGPWSAIGWSSLFYALLHFMKPRALPEGVGYDWVTNWEIFLSTFTSPWQWRHLDSFTALFCGGILLGVVRRRSGHIGGCIGLHAGWVFVIQVTRHLTDGDDGAALAFLVGDYDGVIGWLAAGWIAVLALALALPSQPRTPRRRPDA